MHSTLYILQYRRFLEKNYFILRKIHKNCLLPKLLFLVQMSYATNRLSAGVEPQISLGKLTALLTDSWFGVGKERIV